MSDCFEDPRALGGADIAFYLGATGRMHTRQWMRQLESSLEYGSEAAAIEFRQKGGS